MKTENENKHEKRRKNWKNKIKSKERKERRKEGKENNMNNTNNIIYKRGGGIQENTREHKQQHTLGSLLELKKG